MNIIDVANCASPDSIFNTGIPLCDLAKGKIKGVVFLDRGVTFTTEDCASVVSFIAAVKAKTVAARGSRAYPLWDLLNFEDNTGDPTTGSIGNLSTATIVVSDAVPTFRFGYNGSEARHRALAAIAGSSVDAVFVDDKFAVFGTAKGDDLGGYSILQAYVDTSKFIVADAVNQYAFRLTLGSITEYRDLSRYVVSNSGILSAMGLINVNLKPDGSTANAHDFIIVADGGTDLGPLYGAIIDGLTFTATNLETGDVFVVTSVAYAAGVITITLNSTAWTALDIGDRVQINGPSASALSAADVKPFEIIPVIVTKAA